MKNTIIHNVIGIALRAAILTIVILMMIYQPALFIEISIYTTLGIPLLGLTLKICEIWANWLSNRKDVKHDS